MGVHLSKLLAYTGNWSKSVGAFVSGHPFARDYRIHEIKNNEINTKAIAVVVIIDLECNITRNPWGVCMRLIEY